MKKVIYVLFVLLIFPFNVKANIICNDGTESLICSDCHRGCCSHHGGCSNSSFSGNFNNNQQSAIKEIPKSSDTSLNLIKIDDNNIDISDTMSYYTKKNCKYIRSC